MSPQIVFKAQIFQKSEQLEDQQGVYFSRFQEEDKHTNFIANGTISVWYNISENDNFMWYDYQIVLRRQSTNELHILEARECVKIELELYLFIYLFDSLYQVNNIHVVYK